MRGLCSQCGIGAVLAVIAAALAGCVGGAPHAATDDQPTITRSSAAPSSAAPSFPAVPPSLPAPSSGTGTAVPLIRTLPDSAAALPRSYSLAAVPGVPDLAVALKRGNPRAGLVLEAALNRLVTRGGRPLGGLQIMRVRRAFADPKQMGEFFAEGVKEYTADPNPARRVLAGRDVVWVDKVRQSPYTVIAWTRGPDILMLWGPDPSALKTLAIAMLTPVSA